jgi:pentalenolactone F synthase
MRLSITPLEAPFGAKVEGWDPGSPLSETDFGLLQGALRDHVLLLFRGHRTPRDEELVSFARCFGEVAPVADLWGVTWGHPDILLVTNEVDEDGYDVGVGGSSVLTWHADYSYLDRPAKESFLEASKLPGEGGVTSFCNLYRAWEWLDPSVREKLAGLHASHRFYLYRAWESPDPSERKKLAGVHVSHRSEYAAANEEQRRGMSQERQNPGLRDPMPKHQVWHPIAFQHPEFGKTALYMDVMVREIEGMTVDAAKRLRDDLIAAATAPDNVYRHEWRLGDMVVFDAVGSLHQRGSFDPHQVRTMRQLSTIVPSRQGL